MIDRPRDRLIENWNLLVNEFKKYNIPITLNYMNEEGICDGQSKVFLFYQHQNRDEEFDFFIDFLSALNKNDIINIAKRTRNYLENKLDKSRFFPISLGKETYSFGKLLDFVIAMNDTQITQAKSHYKSIVANWDVSHIIVCPADQLTEYLEKCKIMEGQ